jgi:hypothetical protein
MNKTGITDPNVREEIMSARQGRMLFLEQNSTKDGIKKLSTSPPGISDSPRD